MDERVPEVTGHPGDVSGSRTMELIRQSVRYAYLAVLVTLAALWFLGDPAEPDQLSRDVCAARARTRARV